MSQISLDQQIKRVEFQLRIEEAYADTRSPAEIAEWKAVLATLIGLQAVESKP